MFATKAPKNIISEARKDERLPALNGSKAEYKNMVEKMNVSLTQAHANFSIFFSIQIFRMFRFQNIKWKRMKNCAVCCARFAQSCRDTRAHFPSIPANAFNFQFPFICTQTQKITKSNTHFFLSFFLVIIIFFLLLCIIHWRWICLLLFHAKVLQYTLDTSIMQQTASSIHYNEKKIQYTKGVRSPHSLASFLPACGKSSPEIVWVNRIYIITQFNILICPTNCFAPTTNTLICFYMVHGKCFSKYLLKKLTKKRTWERELIDFIIIIHAPLRIHCSMFNVQSFSVRCDNQWIFIFNWRLWYP